MSDSLELTALEQRVERIRHMALLLVQDPHDADDLAQDAWVRALTHRPQSAESWSAWISATLRNLARIRWRSDRRREAREREAARSEAQPSSSELLERLDAFDSVVRAVRELEEPYRSAIVARFFEGIPPREIADRTGTAVKTIDTRLSRAIEKLRRKLDQGNGGRSAWLTALLPLTRLPEATLAGTLIMNLKLKAVVVVVLLAVGLFFGVRELRVPSHAEEVIVAEQLPRPAPPPDPAIAVESDRRTVQEVSTVPPTDSDSIDQTAISEPAQRVVHGIVVDDNGNPASGVAVVFTTLAERLPAPGVRATSDISGQFEISIPSGMGWLDVGDSEWIAVLRPWLEGTRDSLEQVLVIAPRVSLSGRVVDEVGAPLDGAVLSISISSDLSLGGDDFGFRSRIKRSDTTSLPGEWGTRSAQLGRFKISSAPLLKEALLLIECRGYRADLRRYDKEVGEMVIRLASSEEPGSTMHLVGTVVDQVGTPIKNALVVLFGHRPGPGARSDEHGRFDISVTDQREVPRSLRAIAANHLPAEMECAGDSPTALGAWPQPLILVLGGEPLTISGRLLDADGTPVAGAVIENIDETIFQWTQGGNHRGASTEAVLQGWDGSGMPVVCDGEGRFSVKGLLDKKYRLRSAHRKRMTSIVSEPIQAGSMDVELRFPVEQETRIAGVVRNRRGELQVGTELWLHRDTFDSEHIRSDAAGQFDFGMVPLAPYSLFAAADGFSSRVEHPLKSDGDLEHLEILVVRHAQMQVDLRGSIQVVDEIALLDPNDQPLALLVRQGDGTVGGPRYSLSGLKKSPVFSVPEDARTLVSYSRGVEIGRIGVRLVPGELTIVRL